MTGSTAARRFISRRIGCGAAHLAADPDAELLFVIVAAVALVDMDAASPNTGQLLQFTSRCVDGSQSKDHAHTGATQRREDADADACVWPPARPASHRPPRRRQIIVTLRRRPPFPARLSGRG